MSILSNIKGLGIYNLVLIVLVFLTIVFFETFQQFFYIERFDLYENVSFFRLLKNQFYRWVIWFVIGMYLIYSIKKDINKKLNLSLLAKYFGVILLLVFINILLITFIQILISGTEINISTFFFEYFLFYVFQKSPIYFWGYSAITVILFLAFSKSILQIKVQKLLELKKENDKVYQKLKLTNTDRAKVLNIKVGNKHKIIPIETITWLEADDYCVIVHTTNNPSYSMRTSLKSLENILENNFLRVHRKSIVNMKMVTELNLSTTPKLILEKGEEVFVSKSNLRTVKEYFES